MLTRWALPESANANTEADLPDLSTLTILKTSPANARALGLGHTMSKNPTEKELHKILNQLMPDAHWQRIESWQIGAGIPDRNGCYKGVEVWIECKVVQGKKINLSPLQINWIEKRTRAGGCVFILAWHKKTGPRLNVNELIVWGGHEVREVKEHGIDAPGQRFYFPVNGDELRRFIFGC